MTVASGVGEVWTYHLHPEVLLAVGGLALGYTVALVRWRPDPMPANTPAASATQRFSFYLGVLILLASAGWPLHDLAERSSFSFHMVQHLAFAFVVPPLLLVGVPKWLWRRLLRPPLLLAVWRRVTRPIVALILFNGMVVAIHWPVLVDLSLRSEPVHLLLHSALIGSALAMWWCVVAPLPELRRLSEPAKMFYLFLQSVIPTVPASFLTFATAPVYTTYVGMPHLFGLSPLDDQRLAGLIMKLGGGLLLWSIIAVMFFKWSAREESGRPEDELDWEDFERELDTWELRT